VTAAVQSSRTVSVSRLNLLQTGDDTHHIPISCYTHVLDAVLIAAADHVAAAVQGTWPANPRDRRNHRQFLLPLEARRGPHKGTTRSHSVKLLNYTEAMWEIRASGLMIGEGETGPAEWTATAPFFGTTIRYVG
jgi:hypothetical protein